MIEYEGKRWVKLQDVWKMAQPNSTRVSAINTLKAVPDEHKIKMAPDEKGPDIWYLDYTGASLLVAKAASISKTQGLLKKVAQMFEESKPARQPRQQQSDAPLDDSEPKQVGRSSTPNTDRASSEIRNLIRKIDMQEARIQDVEDQLEALDKALGDFVGSLRTSVKAARSRL